MYLNINDDYYNVDVILDGKFDRYVVYYDNAKDFNITYFCNDGEYESLGILKQADYIKGIIEHELKR